MATARPFTYNPDAQIPGTEKYGNLSVGFPTSGFESTGLQWWNGPDEDLGYVIAKLSVDINGDPQQPTPVVGQLGNVGFFRTQSKDDNLFVELSNAVTGQNFTTPSEAKTWLESNEYWTSYMEITTTTTLTPTTTTTTVLPTGVVLNLDAINYTGSGDWLDTSGNDNNGTLVNSPTYSSNEDGYFELSGGFYAGSGSGLYDHIRVLDDNTLDTMSEISIEMWVNISTFSAPSSVNMLFSKRGTTSNGYVGFFTNTAVTFRIGTSSPSQLVWSTTLSLNTWQQIVITVGSGGSKIYHNGVEVVNNPSYVGNFSNIDTTANLLIGDINPVSSGIYAFNGKISVFRIYDTILSSGDVLSNFDNIKNRYGL